MKITNKHIILTPISMMVFVVMFSCGGEKVSTEDSSRDDKPVVRTEQPQQRYHRQVLHYTGTIKPWREANLGTSIPGRVEAIFFEEGDKVEKDALVAQLSAEPAIMAQVEKETWENDYNRVKRLKERGSISQQDYDHVKAQYEAALAKYELMRKNTEIRAPFAGHLMEIMVQPGETFSFMPALQPRVSFSPGIVRVMQLHPLKAEFHVPEKELSLLHKAEEITVTSNALNGKIVEASLHKTSSMVTASNRTVAAELKISLPDTGLMVGMFTEIEAKLPGKQRLFIPSHALHENDTGSFVWLVNSNNRIEKRRVTKQLSTDGDIAIEGLNITDRVLVAGYRNPEEGKTVVVATEP